MAKHKPFRSVFYYRNKNTKWRYIVKVVFPPLQTVEIGEIIGGGLYIPHSIAVISPYKAGKNLSVLTGVVIGKNGEGDRSKTKAIDLIIHKGRVGEVYNIGGHNEMKNIDIVKIICKALDKPESLITYVTDRKGHDMRYAIDPTKIHNELGWLPETMFKDGIQKTIKWYLDNKEWWETIISGEYQNYYEKMYKNR